jgi:hypothetical protein
MNRSNGEKAHTLKDLVARALFQDQHKFRSWDNSKLYVKANALNRAQLALERAGIKDMEIVTEVKNPKEGAR